jgi:glutamate 5-kinase
LKRHGHKVVLVSSGAIGVGLKRMNIKSRPKNLSGKQVCVLFLFILFLQLLKDKN